MSSSLAFLLSAVGMSVAGSLVYWRLTQRATRPSRRIVYPHRTGAPLVSTARDPSVSSAIRVLGDDE